MPKAISKKDYGPKLDALNSWVQFSTLTKADCSPDGEYIVDSKDRAKNHTLRQATLITKSDNRPWLSATANEDMDALREVLKKAESTDRPASTASDMAKQIQQLQAELAASRASEQRTREGVEAGSVDPKPDASVDKRPAKKAEPLRVG